MAGHLTKSELLAFGQHRLPPPELLRADEHLAGCASCRQALETTLDGSALALHAELQSALPDALPHLSFTQMARFVDETLDAAERAFVSDHVASCAQCAVAVDDLRAFTLVDKTAATPTPAVAMPEWREKLRGLFRPLASVPAFGLALAALLLVVLASWLWRLAFQAKPGPPEFAHQTATGPALASSVTLPAPTPEPVQLLAQLNDAGRQVTLDRQGRLTGLDELSAAQQEMVKAALTTQRLAAPATLAGLNRRGSSLMGADEQGNQFVLRAPVGQVVLSDRPTFRWLPLTGASSYVVEIYDEQFNLAQQSPALVRTEWTPPQPLARGHHYAWQVKANKDGQQVQAPKPPAPQARFLVLAQAQADEIRRARRSPIPSHLTLGLLYAQAGLLDEAERELRVLLKANPNDETVRRWLAQAQAPHH